MELAIAAAEAGAAPERRRRQGLQRRRRSSASAGAMAAAVLGDCAGNEWFGDGTWFGSTSFLLGSVYHVGPGWQRE